MTERASHHVPQGEYSVQRAAVIVGATILAVLVPAALVVQVPDTGRSSAWVLTLALTAYSGARLAHRIIDGRPLLFDFIFWLFVYLFMGIAPTVQIRSGEISTTTPGMDPALDGRTALLVWCGVLCYEIGRNLWRMSLSRRPTIEHSSLPAAPALDVIPGRAVILTLVGVVAATYYVSRVGVGTLFINRYDSFTLRTQAIPDLATRSVISAMATYPLLIASGVYILVWRAKALGAASGRYLPLLLVTVPPLLILVNPISGARYEVGTIGFAMIVFLGSMATRARARWSMVGVLVAFVFIFPIADAFRSKTVNVTRNGFFGEYLANPDYDAFWQIGNAASLVADGMVAPFRQALGVAFFWVPRGVWPTKPQDTGILLADYRGYSFGNLSAPLWAEFLVNGGVALLVVGFILTGWLIWTLDRRASVGMLAGGQFWVLIGGVFPFYMVILLRGSLLQATGTLVVAASCAAFVRRPSAAEPPSTGPQASGDTDLGRRRELS